MILAAAGRLDWGLGNPNKTGALIALLLPLVWGVVAHAMRRVCGAHARTALFAAGLAACAALGVCLLLTESRGGVVGALLALGVLAAYTPRPWPRGRLLSVSLAVLACVFVAGRVGALRRMEPAYAAGDASIANRLSLWRAAPAMIADAPDGWGEGRAGPEYGRWYQNPAHSQPYRVLVSSHLTFLAEHGNLARTLYLFSWIGALLASWSHARRTREAAALGALAGQAAAWQFSDVAESRAVLGLTVATALYALVRLALTSEKGRFEISPAALTGVKGAAGALLTSVALVAGVNLVCGGEIRRGASRVAIAGELPGLLEIRAMPGEGGPTPREWRECFPVIAGRPTTLWPDASGRPVTGLRADTLVRFPGARLTGDDAPAVLVLINPEGAPDELLPAGYAGAVRVIYGEFARKPGRAAWERVARVSVVEGESGYLSDWPRYVVP